MVFQAAPLDHHAERITTRVAYIGGVLLLPMLFAYLVNMSLSELLFVVVVSLATVSVPLVLLLLVTYAGQPVEYGIETENLLVRRRLLPTVTIPLAHITGVSFAPMLADVPRRGMRFGFNPGLFGYQGPFDLDPFGRVFFIATNHERLVAVAQLYTVPFILSPARPRAFMDALNEEIERGRARSNLPDDASGGEVVGFGEAETNHIPTQLSQGMPLNSSHLAPHPNHLT
jgi:hypothetical protein